VFVSLGTVKLIYLYVYLITFHIEMYFFITKPSLKMAFLGPRQVEVFRNSE